MYIYCSQNWTLAINELYIDIIILSYDVEFLQSFRKNKLLYITYKAYIVKSMYRLN